MDLKTITTALALLGSGLPLAVDPTRAGVPAWAGWAGDWVTDLVSRYGTAADGGVATRSISFGSTPWAASHLRAFLQVEQPG